jgi:putative ABC transport system permease protein
MIKYFKLAVKNITHRKLRSWLTIIGVIIGIASIVSLISISNGMQNAIEEQFEQFGTDMITITPSGFMGPATGGSANFDDNDINVLERISELKFVVPMVTHSSTVTFHNQDMYLSVFAYKAERELEGLWEDVGFEIDKGRFPREGDGRVVGLGATAATNIFDDEIHVRNNIFIDGEKFRVAGIAKEVGNSQDDNAIFMPLDTALEFYNQTDYNFIMAVAKEGVDVDPLADRIERKLERSRDDDNFQVMTATEIIESIGQILSIIQIVLVGIAGISLLVGAVGIMNTTYTSVLERTREIGIMKAVGATNNAILSIFLIEAGVIGIVGGIIGATIGTLIALGVGVIAQNMALPLPLSIRVEWALIGFSVLFTSSRCS